MNPQLARPEVNDSRSPQRTCAGCRARADRDELVRFVRADVPSRLVPDLRRRFPGRGVSVHPTRRCIEAACGKGGFSRGFRVPLRVAAEPLIDALRTQLDARIDSLLLAALRRHAAVVGTEAVRQTLRRGQGELLIVATDAANRREELHAAATRLGSACVEYSDTAGLGRLCRRPAVSVVLITERGLAQAIAAAADGLRGLVEER